jgi:SAM-dependent methyltransferase
VDEAHRDTAAMMHERVGAGCVDREELRRALASVPPTVRDAWLDLVLGLGELPDDGPELPRDCVPYLPCPADVLVRMVDEASIRDTDVFVDVGAGVGRAAACVNLLTGAAVIGIEIQPRLARAARELTERLRLSRAPRIIEGDAADLTGRLATGTVFFLYCPFGAGQLATWLEAVEPIARAKPTRICCVDLTLPPRPWLTQVSIAGELAIYRSIA